MKYNGPKARKVRRLGMNLYGSDKYDKIMQRKPFGPGKNAKTRQARDSEYAKQLRTAQPQVAERFDGYAAALK